MTTSDEAHRIGRVVGVESEKLHVELEESTGGFVKAGPSGVIPIGSINSYVAAPAGQHRVIAVISAIKMSPGVNEGVVIRQLDAVMVGRFEGDRYRPGVVAFPSLFAPVAPASPAELEAIFRPPTGPSLVLGSAVVVPGQSVHLDVERLLSRHCAVLGSTGAGKSCTLTALVDGLFELGLKTANVVILDTTGEYRSAFAHDSERGRRTQALTVGPEPGAESGLFVPHWFMTIEEQAAFLQASEATQAPILQQAIVDARLSSYADQQVAGPLFIGRRSLQDLRDLMLPSTHQPQLLCAQQLRGLEKYAHERESKAGDETAKTAWGEIEKAVSSWQGLKLDENPKQQWEQPLEPAQLETIQKICRAADEIIAAELTRLGIAGADSGADFGAPTYFDLKDLYRVHLPKRTEMAAVRDSRVRTYMATLFVRLERLLSDARYDFISHAPDFKDALARFLRLVLGKRPLEHAEAPIPPWSEALRKVFADDGEHQVVIFDLSLIASDILGDVTALIGRLLLDFSQRAPRERFPVLLLLEEAHRYVASPSTDGKTRSTVVFERIAKEGRKFGLSLIVASQRPSELSRTLLSQCGTLIAHRLVNPEDQDLVRSATPFASRETLNQLPGLATQHAVVLGEAVALPSLVRVRTIPNPPLSTEPQFIKIWRNAPSAADTSDIEAIAHRWEEGKA